jgi:glutathione S-transferase
VLKCGSLTVWDSLAIIELLAERHPNLPIWPKDADARAIARSVAAEMHSGFADLRSECPMDFARIIGFPQVSDKTLADISRIVEIWRECRGRFGKEGDFLFGAFSAADVMYAPVASRFTTYAVDLARFGDDGSAERYRAAMMAMPEMQAWGEGARAEIEAG